MTHHQNGFSLIELMIVVAIIGILSSLAIPAYNDYVYTSRISVMEDHLQQLRLFEEAYFLNNQTYLAGTMQESTMTTSLLATELKFKPGSEGAQFLYTVESCSSGPIDECFTATIKWAENPTADYTLTITIEK